MAPPEYREILAKSSTMPIGNAQAQGKDPGSERLSLFLAVCVVHTTFPTLTWRLVSLRLP
jgi:hypothetical protein